jgi:hypothetical protein
MGVDRGKHPLANIPNYPPWLCQPYVRPPLVENKRKLASEAAEEGLQTKREHDQVEDDSTEKSAKKPCKKPMSVQTCQFCTNVASPNCAHQACKRCCRHKNLSDTCEQHRRVPKKSVSEAPTLMSNEVNA